MSNNGRRKSQAAGVTGAYIFFAALYFVQSVGDPTSGLIAQPVRSLLTSWGESPAALGALMALLAVPWTIKPVFGFLSDFVPLFGSRRRSYLLLANGLAAASLLLLAFVPLAPGSRWLLFALLLPTTMAIALGDVIVDALMVQKGQPLGLTGRFQSILFRCASGCAPLKPSLASEFNVFGCGPQCLRCSLGSPGGSALWVPIVGHLETSISFMSLSEAHVPVKKRVVAQSPEAGLSLRSAIA